ncbi:hypothetical protein [Bradyrhizobium sp. LTSP857]|uniref:hypothetical protein n=1 Tax=Bradyrhizobium sp. LTSP857 TaxID=1619231 RepID=UPI0012E006F6|nr:hypothetical protein [Bradyrhizobium sp. LTSP857]
MSQIATSRVFVARSLFNRGVAVDFAAVVLLEVVLPADVLPADVLPARFLPAFGVLLAGVRDESDAARTKRVASVS